MANTFSRFYKLYYSLLGFPISVLSGLKHYKQDSSSQMDLASLNFKCLFSMSFLIPYFVRHPLLVVLLTAGNRHMLLICNDNI